MNKKSLLVCILVGSFIWLTACSNTEQSTVLEKEPDSTQIEEIEDVKDDKKEENIESNQYLMGETLMVNNYGRETFELTVTDVTLTDDRNQFSDKVVENVAIITVVGKNISDESEYLSDSYFQFYDETGSKLNTYPISGQYSSIEEVSPGRNATVQFAIGIEKGSSIEIEVFNEGDKKPFGIIDTTKSVEPTIDLSTTVSIPEIILGDIINVTDYEKETFELAVTDVTLTDDRNQFSDKVVENVAIITVVGKNISDESEYLSDSYFQFYDETGAKLNTYPVSGQYSSIEEVSPGRNATIQIAIGIETGTSLDIEVVNGGANNPSYMIRVQ